MGWWIPLRSIWRNRRRTVLSIGIIALGTAVSFFVLGFVESSRRLIQESTVHEYGNLQIGSPDLWNGTADSYDRLIPPDAVAQIEAALAEEPTLVGSTVQLQFPGLLARGERTQVVRATGVVPGNGVLEFNDLVFIGRGLAPDDRAAILIGRSLAEKLALSPGDAITLTLTTVDGAYNASPFTVAGVFRFTSEAFEQQVVFMPLGYAQRLLNTPGVDRVIASLSSLEATNPARQRLQSALRGASLAVDVKTWDELSPFYRQLSSYFSALFGFLSAAVSILVFFIILQVLTLAFLERTREIGTLRAIGTTRAQVFRLFLAESAWLAVVGSAAGVVIGTLLGLGFNAVGIEWRPPGTVEPVRLAVQLGVATAAVPFVVSVAATLLSALFPSIEAARLRVVDALRVE
ncbi:MAG: ABC transporter permease [Candidatus Bipolaricaulis sp.]|nr:ABC transporter permease [Candidatus Bipolaricaulis sp.]MDD5220806.1 ABC transporter permease [Candidatus Bipolaricaulis sp.]